MKKIPYSEYNRWRKSYYAGNMFERFGQSFINFFEHGFQCVRDAHRESSLWAVQDDNHADYLICHQLQLVDWEA